MEFDPHLSNNLDFSPPSLETSVDFIAAYLAESSIIRAIVQGSGGPDNVEITDGGLRFVRHLLATSSATPCGFLPNLKDAETIREIARDFIRQSGSAATALQNMYTIMRAS